jgi:hypothetical protein
MTIADHLTASRIIAARHPLNPPLHPLPRSKADIRVHAEYARAIAARDVVQALEERAAEEEGRRTNAS